MVEVDGSVNVKTEITIKKAIEVLYDECVKIGKNETDKTDERTKNIFDSIEFLRKNYEDVVNPENDEYLSKIRIDGILTTTTNLNSYGSSISVDGIKVLCVLDKRLETVHLNKKADSEYLKKLEEVKSIIKYLKENYFNYLNRSTEEQDQFIVPEEILGNSCFVNYWDFLGIPADASLIMIKEAYMIKYYSIETSIFSGDKQYTVKSLIDLNRALYTLSDTKLRYAYKCILEGKRALHDEYIKEIEISKNGLDFDYDANKILLNFIYDKIKIFNSAVDNAPRNILYGVIRVDDVTMRELGFSINNIHAQLTEAMKNNEKNMRR